MLSSSDARGKIGRPATKQRRGLEQLANHTLRDAAFSALQQALMRGEFEPGGQLDLFAIAKELGVSVTPVKEAVALLAHYGLVEILPRRGTRVREITVESLRQACEARLVMERWAASVFKERAGAEELSSLAGILAALDEVTREMPVAGDYIELAERFSELDFAYHRSIVSAAHNEYTLKSYVSLATPFLTARAMAHLPQEAAVDRCVAGQQEHWRIYEALRAGDKKRAVSEITAHVETSARRAAQAITASGGTI